MARRRPYARAHRYTLSASSHEFLARQAPFVLALIAAPGSRLSEYARGVAAVAEGHQWPVTVEVSPYGRIVLPIALLAGAGGLTLLSLGEVAWFVGCAVLTVGALVAGRQEEETWMLALESSTEAIEAVTARSALGAEARSLPESAAYVARTANGRYLWDAATWALWDAAGQPEALRIVRLSARVEGEAITGEALRALHVG